LDKEDVFAFTISTWETFIHKFSFCIFINKLKYFEAFFHPKCGGLKPLLRPHGSWAGPDQTKNEKKKTYSTI